VTMTEFNSLSQLFFQQSAGGDQVLERIVISTDWLLIA